MIHFNFVLAILYLFSALAKSVISVTPSEKKWVSSKDLAGSKPNILILFADDFGYGDVGHNNPEVGTDTQYIDALAASGITFKDMHTFPLCTPSRAQLLTGRLGARTGVVQNFVTESLAGLPRSEHTIAELLKPAGYDTVQLGKYHLGTHAGFHPTFRGFDQSLTVPYSVDMGCLGPADGPYWNLPQPPPCPTGPNTDPNSQDDPALPLYNATLNCGGDSCNKQIIQQPVRETQLDSHYVDYLSSYFEKHSAPGSNPFFAYMAFSHTHVPLFFDPKFANSSSRKTIFADTTMEFDDSVNRIIKSLHTYGLAENTLVLATADNGPWKVKCELAGSPGPFTGEYQKKLGGGSALKDTTWEGGQRVFGLASWPGKIKPGIISNATVSSLDFLPTILALAGVPLPTDRSFDGVDLGPLLFDGQQSVRDFLFMGDTTGGGGPRGGNITSVRYKNWKLYTKTYSQPGCNEPAAPHVDHPNYLVFDLDVDPSESTPITLPQDIMDLIWKEHHAKLADINTTFQSNADYSTGSTMISAAPCCNPNNAVCRCEPTL